MNDEATFQPTHTDAVAPDPAPIPTDPGHGAGHWLAFLAEVSAALNSAGDDATRFAQLRALLIPTVVDVYSITTVQTNGTLTTIASAHYDPQRQAILNKLEAQHHFDAATPFGVAQVIRNRQPIYFAQITPELITAHSRNLEHADLLVQLNMHNGAILPLIVRDDVIGAISLGMVQPERHISPHDAPLLNEIALRVALMIDNLRLRQQAQEANGARDAMLAVLAHELKTPLTALSTQIQLLQRRINNVPSLDARIDQGVKMIHHQTQRMHLLINMLLASSPSHPQAQDFSYEPIDLNQVAANVCDTVVSVLNQHTLNLHLHPDPLMILGDSLRIEQALQNLLQNAVKYSPSGGTITCRLERTATTARISISDPGIGIPSADRAHIFERFYRASNAVRQRIGGIGIGLYFVYTVINLHRGQVSITDTPGGGTTFIVELPLIASP